MNLLSVLFSQQRWLCLFFLGDDNTRRLPNLSRNISPSTLACVRRASRPVAFQASLQNTSAVFCVFLYAVRRKKNSIRRGFFLFSKCTPSQDSLSFFFFFFCFLSKRQPTRGESNSLLESRFFFFVSFFPPLYNILYSSCFLFIIVY